MKSMLIGCVVVASLMGCQKKEPPPPPPVASAVAPPAASGAVIAAENTAPSAAPQPAAAPSDSERAAKIPVQEDFEKQAKATVSKPTLKQNLDKLDKEIAK